MYTGQTYLSRIIIWITGFEDSDKILVLDIRDDNYNNYKLIECKIKCPQEGCFGIVRIGGIENELLVIGWIKRLFKTKEFKNLVLPPMYLMKIVLLWYGQEMIHWFGQRTHYAIELRHILSSLL